jgi:hypothetical protein
MLWTAIARLERNVSEEQNLSVACAFIIYHDYYDHTTILLLNLFGRFTSHRFRTEGAACYVEVPEAWINCSFDCPTDISIDTCWLPS